MNASSSGASKPLSEQIAQQLRGMIFDEHRFNPGDRMPDERSLALEMVHVPETALSGSGRACRTTGLAAGFCPTWSDLLSSLYEIKIRMSSGICKKSDLHRKPVLILGD